MYITNRTQQTQMGKTKEEDIQRNNEGYIDVERNKDNDANTTGQNMRYNKHKQGNTYNRNGKYKKKRNQHIKSRK